MSLSHAERQTLQQMRDQIDALLNRRECSACLQFDGRTGKCEYWSQVVPVEAREAACDMFQDEIPF